MGMPVSDPPITTVQGIRALPEDEYHRHELLDGVHVVSPPPRLAHQAVLTRLLVAIQNAVGDRRDVAVFPGGEVAPDASTLLVPDLMVIEQDPDRPARTWSEAGIPILAVEILSPGTAARDRRVKRRLYQRAGVAEYWIVDVDAGVVERWRPGDERPEVTDERLTWRPTGGLSVEIALGDLF